MRRKRQRIAATRLFTSSAPIVILIFHRCVHLLVKIIFKKLRLVELLFVGGGASPCRDRVAATQVSVGRHPTLAE